EKSLSRWFPPQSNRRDGAEKSYFVCQTGGALAPPTLIDHSSRQKLAGANRGPVGGSRRGNWAAKKDTCPGSQSRRLARGGNRRTKRSWTWCRTGLLRLRSGRSWVRIPPGPSRRASSSAVQSAYVP